MFPFLVDINMIQTRKMEEGDKTPQLYTHYGKQYEFSNLQRDADQGLGEYLSSLKRGQKDSEQFRKAYSDLMSGIGDGSITFSNGRFVDSRGRYTNSKDKDRDYYGLMANYIYGKMGRGQNYTPPEDTSKIKWGDGAGSQLFARKMFNSNTINIPYFMDLDPYDEKTGRRGTQNRAKAIADLIQNELVNNYDAGFRDFTPEQKSSYLNYAQQALNAIQDGTIDSGDYLALYRIMPGIAWEEMFSTQEKLQEQQSTPEAKDQQSQQEQPDQNRTSKDFADYVDANFPRLPNSSSSIDLSTQIRYGQWTQNQILRAIKGMDENTLMTYLNKAIQNQDGDFGYDKAFIGAGRVSIPSKWLTRVLIARLKGMNKLVQDSTNTSIYYIPDLVDPKTKSGYYYDENTNTVYKKSVRDIPYWQQYLYRKWSGDNSEPWMNQFFTEAKKNGGILKAQTGTSLWYSGLTDYDPAKYSYSYDTSRLVDADMSDNKWDPWVSNVSGVGTGRYQPTAGNTREYTRSIEETPYYQQFRKDLLNPNGTFTEVGLEWAKQTDKLLPKGSPATFFDENGKLRTSWTVTNRDVYGRKPQTFTNLADYVNYVNYDQILGGRHNTFLNTGKRYFYKDKDGVEHWVDPNEISNYEVSTSPVRSQWNDDKTVYWNDYELTGLKQPQQLGSDEDSDIYLTESWKKQRNGSLNNFFQNLAPDLAGLSRLFLSLNTNNRVARTLNRTLRPVLRDTYERYSPVTGAFSEMQLRNRQAADLRRQSARPFTSDASLQLAGQLDANRQARELEHQGFLADDQEIRRTKAEALTRQEDNMARRSEVSNFNRASINQTNREKSQLEATRLKSNWQSIDNFLQGVESRLRYNTENRKNLSQQIALSEVSDEYQRNLDFLNQKFKEKYPNATSSDMLNNSQYVNAVKRLRRRLQYENNNVLMNQYRIGQYRTPPSYTEILNNVVFSKKGGQLHPSSMYLIDKVIRNESNS